MKQGIDVSYAQGNIDFSKIDKSQVEFAVIRIGYGKEDYQKDDQFERNYTNFKKLGIPIGAYHYSYAKNAEDGKKEAEYCLSCIGSGKVFELPIYLDMEEGSVTSSGKTNLTEAAIAFCKTMESAGYKSGVYSFVSYFNNNLDVNKIKQAGLSIWLAQWEASKPSINCDIWQYKVGKKGTVNGITGEIDMNYLCNESILSNVGNNSVVSKDSNDINRFITQAKNYIGKDGAYVCQTKLNLGYITEWCAYSISSIMQDCGFIGKYIKQIEGGAGTIPRFSDGKYGTWFPKGDKAPKSGDLILFRYGGNYTDKYHSDHIGIVESVSGNVITTLEGNVEGKSGNWAATSTFKRKTRYLNDNSVYAFYRPNWKADTSSGSTVVKSIETIAKEVLAGKWGNGEERKKKLTDKGYDYSKVQEKVNELLHTSQTVMVKKGNIVKVKSGAKQYGTNNALDSWVSNTKFTVMEVCGDRVVIGINGSVTAAVNKKDIVIV